MCIMSRVRNHNIHFHHHFQEALLTLEIKYNGHPNGEDGASDDEQGHAPRLQRRLTARKLSIRKKLKIIEPSGASDVESEGITMSFLACALKKKHFHISDAEDVEAPGQPFRLADMAEL